MGKLARGLALGLLFIYRALLSPFTGCTCRFVPSCSIYAQNAFRGHGPARAFWLTLTRILRCRPFGGCGFDPVPERTQ